MENRGIIRSVDALGRIVIPSEVRKLFGITAGSELELVVEGDRIVYKKVKERSVRDALEAAACALEERSPKNAAAVAEKLAEALALLDETE